MVKSYIYWCISNLSDLPDDQIRYSSLLHSIETTAVTVEFGVQAIPTALIVTARFNFILWFLASSGYATLQVPRKFKKLNLLC
jgi:hypothetical protein